MTSFVKTKTDFFSLKDRDLTASINPINILMFMIWIVLFRTFKVLGIKTRTSMESFFQPANSNSLFIFYSNEQQASFHQNLKNALRKIQLLKDVKYAISWNFMIYWFFSIVEKELSKNWYKYGIQQTHSRITQRIRTNFKTKSSIVRKGLFTSITETTASRNVCFLKQTPLFRYRHSVNTTE